MRFSDRLATISTSSTVAVMEKAQELRAAGVDIIDLGPGLPDFPTPEVVKAAGIAAIETDFTVYTQVGGTKELRQAVADEFNRNWNSDFSYRNVIMTNGAKHAIFNLCLVAFQEDDRVLIPCPYWVTFPEAVKIAGAKPLHFTTPEDEGFLVSPSTVRKLAGDDVRGLIVNTPNNPTGALFPEESVRELAELCRDLEMFLLFDETYEHFTYGGKEHFSLAGAVKPTDDCYAVIGSFSKTYAMTGWRIGYCLGPEALIEKMTKLQSHQTGNPSSIGQKAAMAALRSGPQSFEPMRIEYERRRDFVLQYLSDIAGFECTVPDGAFYVFPNVAASMRGVGCDNSVDFSRLLLEEARVATTPGSAFGLEGHIRMSYATSPENLAEGLKRIKGVV